MHRRRGEKGSGPVLHMNFHSESALMEETRLHGED